MKHLIAITVGIGILATAGATAISTPNNVTSAAGVTSQVTLTAEQIKVLQARYRYWSSSQPVTLKTPI
ncbi:MAG: hypothetical protein ABUS47_15070 [Steroidobacter sp.]